MYENYYIFTEKNNVIVETRNNIESAFEIGFIYIHVINIPFMNIYLSCSSLSFSFNIFF